MPKEPTTVKSLVTLIDNGLRLRRHLEVVKGELKHFAVTLEVEFEADDWRAVVRYDTEGGTPHRDRFKPDGSYLTHREAVRLGSTFHDALNAATDDLRQNRERYVRDFRNLLP